MGSGFDYRIYWTLSLQLQLIRADLLQSLLDYDCLIFHCVFVLTYESVTSSGSVVRWLTLHSWIFNSLTTELRLNYDSLRLNCNWLTNEFRMTRSSKFMLRPTVSRPVCLGIKHPSGAYDQICITVRHLLVFGCGELSVTRGRVCRL
jgi:hypothetical protein